jgi:hypothetical protein
VTGSYLETAVSPEKRKAPRPRATRAAPTQDDEYEEGSGRLENIYDGVKRRRVVYLQADEMYSSDSSDDDLPATFWGCISGSSTPNLVESNAPSLFERNEQDIRLMELQNEKIRDRMKFVQELMVAGKNEEEISTILTLVG